MEQWRKFLAELHWSSVTLVGPYFDPSRQSFSEPVIFVDAGAKFRRGKEGFSVGDGDSFSGALDLTIPKEKNFSDLAFALQALPENIFEAHLLGFAGGRRDHELFNLGEAHRFLKKREKQGKIKIDANILGFAAGSWQVELQGSFSLVLVERASVCLHGDVQYAIPKAGTIEPLSSLGLSNFASGIVGIHTSQPCFIFQNPMG